MPSSACRLRIAALAILLAPFLSLPGVAQHAGSEAPTSAHIDQILALMSRARAISEVVVSPDGKRVAWILSGTIHVALFGNLAASRRVTAALTSDRRCAENDLVWSPDSASLLFSSDCAQPGEQNDLYLSHLDGSPATQLTQLHGDVGSPAFSPDGKRIAFLYVENATRPVGALAAMNAPSGVIGEDHIDVQRIALLPIDPPQPAAPKFATPANLHVYEFDWSADSASLAYIAADPPGENNWWVAKLYTQKLGAPTTPEGAPPKLRLGGMGIDLSAADNQAISSHALAGAPGPGTGTRDSTISKPALILDPATVPGPLHGLQIAVPRWSPNGKTIAFIGGLMSDQGVIGGDVWIVPSSGGQPRDLTPGRPTSSEWIDWEDDRHIYSCENSSGNTQLVRINVQAPQPQPGEQRGRTRAVGEPLFSISGSVGTHRSGQPISVDADRSLFVFSASSFSHPPEIYAVGPAAPPPSGATGSFPALAQLSHLNEGVTPSWGPVHSVEWTNQNFHIQGWLHLPLNYDSSKKYPLIVEVHGGPAASASSSWGARLPLNADLFSELGYFVLEPNPRGSFGQGEAFTQANRKDFGYGDLRDILAGLDTVLAHYSIDPHRVALDGWSYGGFMSMFAVTQTHRFHAAVAGAGISDWLSYYGENSIDQWMIPYFGASVYDDPQVYAKSSAINFMKNVSTPTLVLVGDRDGECPAPQSFEFWHALRDLHVPAELVVYPNEGHGLTDPDHLRDALQRTVDWFARYMPPGAE